MNDPEHLRGIFRARDYLSEQQVLWDFVTDVSNADRLRAFDAIVLTGGRFLSDNEVAALRKYVEGGGTLFIIGEAGTHDQWGKPRKQAAFADAMGRAMPDEHGVRPGMLGRGKLLWATDSGAILAQRPFAAYDFKEDDLANLEGVYKRLSESPEQQPGAAGRLLVDYLEQATGRRLRATDAHAPVLGAGSPLGSEAVPAKEADPAKSEQATAHAATAPYLRFNAWRHGDAKTGRIVLHAVNYNVARTGPKETGRLTASAPAKVILDAPAGWRFTSATRYASDAAPQSIEFTQQGSEVTFTLAPVDFYAVIALSTAR